MARQKIIAGFDIGYGNVKAVFQDRTGKIHHHTFPRVIATDSGVNGAWSDMRSVTVYGMDTLQFLIGSDAILNLKRAISLETRNYMDHPSYWACLAKAFYEEGLLTPDNTIIHIDRLILGLAPGHYSKELVKRMVNTARVGFDIVINHQTYRITAKVVMVLPQGAGAYFSYLFDTNGQYKKGKEAVIDDMFGIVDIGYKTLDFMIFSNGQFVPDVEELSEDNGFKIIVDSLREKIFQRYNLKLDVERLNRSIANGCTMKINRKVVDLKPDLRELSQRYIEQTLEPEMLKRWEDHLPLMERLILCGGGANIIPYSETFSQKHASMLFIPEYPEMDNAKGFFKFGIRTEMESEA